MALCCNVLVVTVGYYRFRDVAVKTNQIILPCSSDLPLSIPTTVTATASSSPTQHLTLPAESSNSRRVPISKAKQVSMQSEVSVATVQSGASQSSQSSISSVDSLLDARRGDAEEMLLDLGFGGGDDAEVARIPKRFLQPSQVKGVDFQQFLRYQQELGEMFDSGLSGYRGLTGLHGQRPSPLVYHILNRISNERRARSSSPVSSPPAVTTTPATPAPQTESPGARFANVARTISLISRVSHRASSVLAPANQEFLAQQNLADATPKAPRRLFLGKKLFSVDHDGDLVEIPTTTPAPAFKKPILTHQSSDNSLVSVSSASVESDVDEAAEELHKLFGCGASSSLETHHQETAMPSRNGRGKLQRQKHVDESSSPDALVQVSGSPWQNVQYMVMENSSYIPPWDTALSRRTKRKKPP